MKRSLAKLLKELNTRIPTQEETHVLIDALTDQEKQARIAKLKRLLKSLGG